MSTINDATSIKKITSKTNPNPTNSDLQTQTDSNTTSLHPSMEDSYYFYQMAAMIFLQMQYISIFSKNLDKDYISKIDDAKTYIHNLLEWIESNYGYKTEYLREDLLRMAV